MLAGVALLAAGCGHAGAETRAAGQAAADRLFPGELAVVADRSLGSGGPGRELIFAVRDDPDAAVYAVVDANRCGPGSDCDAALRRGYDDARVRVAELRALVSVFADCGHPIVALHDLNGSVDPPRVGVAVTVAAVVDDATIGPLGAELDRCIAGWTAARATSGSPWSGDRASIVVEIADPARLADVPAADPGLPLAARLADPGLRAALLAGPHHAAVVGVVEGRAEPVANVLAPVLPFEQSVEFEDAVEAAAAQWLVESGNDPGRAVPLLVATDTRFVPGSAQLLRVYAGLCVRPGGSCGIDAVVAMTVDRLGGGARDLRYLTGIDGADGSRRRPLEPDCC